MGCEPISRDFVPIAPTSPRSIGTLLQAKDATFHVPMLARWNRGDVRLPWLDAAAMNAAATNSGRTQPFLETPEEIMSEIMTATVPGSTVSDFLEIVAPSPIRVKCAIDRSVLIKSGSLDTVAATPMLNGSRYGEEKGSYDLLCDWHAHPRYGMIRALCYRADAGAVSNIQRPNAGNYRGPAKSAASNNLKAAIVEQYHSCTVDTDDDLVDNIDERVSHKAALRTKMYTRGIPYSNCFSIEVLMEVEDIPLNDEDAKRRACPMSDAIMSCLPGQEINSALQIRWRASVVFSRHIKLKAQIERGALNGVQSSCASILKLLQKTSARHRVASPGERQNPILNADGFDKAESTNCITALAANSNSCSSFIRGTREKYYGQQDLVMLPQAFALEAIKGLLSAIADTNLLSDNLSTLPVQLPWRSFTCRQSSRHQGGGYKCLASHRITWTTV
uniref:Uncharacterized protein n=1 Tax=Hyaloperonospora arabidopsidis (strain Emoy2) TaxID=559515 RepID=M4C0D5_HYAAE